MTVTLLTAQAEPSVTLTAASVAALELVDRAAGVIIIKNDPANTVINVESATPTLVLRDVGPQGAKGDPGLPGGRAESGAVLTYAGGRVARIDYASGNYKALLYTGAVLTHVDYTTGATTTRKTFTYNPDGTLAGTSETII
jgi:hypothetical protein